MSTFIATKKRRVDQKLWNALDTYLRPHLPDGVVLAISGGPDSRALMEVVATWQWRHLGPITVAIIDHGLRKDAHDEAHFLMMRAKRLGFDAKVAKLSLLHHANEMDLRKARYDMLKDIAVEKNLSTIVTAHHGDDNAESYFMSLMGVGGGELGAAMKNESCRDGMTLCRPFLDLEKRDLLLSLTFSRHTDFVRDSLDEKRANQRAYVRYEVFPELSRLAPSVIKRLSSFAKIQNQQREILDSLAKSLIIWRNDDALIPLTPKPDAVLLVQALFQIVKKFSNGKDIRASSKKISVIAQEISHENFRTRLPFAGLDPSSNGFNLKDLEVKKYQFPGAVVFRDKDRILVTRS